MFNFDQEFEDDYDAIPAGTYPAQIDTLEWKTSQAGSEYLNACFSIVGEQYANRKVFHVFNLFHQKEQVKRIALASIKKILTANSIETSKLGNCTKDSLCELLSNCTIGIKLSIKRSDEYGDKNEIKNFIKTNVASSASVPADQIPF